MVYSEKIVTAVTRGTVNTRWRDFADMYLLTRRHPIDGTQLGHSVHEVARHRRVDLRPLAEVLPGYGDIGQQRWTAWRAKQQLGDVSRMSSMTWLLQLWASPTRPSQAPRPGITGIREPAPGHKPRGRAPTVYPLFEESSSVCGYWVTPGL